MRRSTIILLIIFILLGVLVWAMQQPGNPLKKVLVPNTSTPSLTTDYLVNPDKGPLKSVSMQDATGKTVIIDKTSGKWIIKTENDQPAQQSLAESAVGQALTIRTIKKFETPPDPSGTGLDKPGFTISLTLADNSHYSFKIGKATVTGSGYYGSLPDGSVVILGKSEVDSLIANFAEPPYLSTATPLPGSATEISPESAEATVTKAP